MTMINTISFKSTKYMRIAFILLILCSLSSTAQITNVDRITADDTAYKNIDFSLQLALSADQQQTKSQYLSSNLELDKNFRNRYVLLGMFSNTMINYGTTGILNKGSALLDYRDKHSRKISPEIYAKLQWNGTWGLDYRTIVGIDGVCRLAKDDKKKFYAYMGLGLFYDWEKWSWNVIPVALQPADAKPQYLNSLRVNSYWKVAAKLSPTIDINTISYFLCPTTKDFFSPRWIFEFNAYLKASNHFNVVLHWDHFYDEQSPLPIKNFFYSYTAGLQIKY